MRKCAQQPRRAQPLTGARPAERQLGRASLTTLATLAVTRRTARWPGGIHEVWTLSMKWQCLRNKDACLTLKREQKALAADSKHHDQESIPLGEPICNGKSDLIIENAQKGMHTSPLISDLSHHLARIYLKQHLTYR